MITEYKLTLHLGEELWWNFPDITATETNVNVGTGLLEKVDPRLCENEVKKLCSPALEVKQSANFSPNFIPPGAHLLVHPCTL